MQTLRAAPWQLWFLVLGAIWGCSFLFIKLGLESLTPIGVAFGRVTIGAVVLLVIARATGTRFPRDRATWRHLAVVGLLFCSIPFTLFAYGETHISSILAGIINACTPLAALLVVFAAFPEQRPGRDRAAGLAVGFVGVLVVVGAWNGLGGGELLGVLACVGAILCYGIAYPYTRRHLSGIPEGPIAIATAQVSLGALFLLPVVVVVSLAGGEVVTAPLAAETVVGMLALGRARVGDRVRAEQPRRDRGRRDGRQLRHLHHAAVRGGGGLAVPLGAAGLVPAGGRRDHPAGRGDRPGPGAAAAAGGGGRAGRGPVTGGIVGWRRDVGP